jgi:ABC-type antimicrobial peptide transport system permease subunit
VALRTREIGVRVAIGASRGAVIGMVIRQALWLILLGAGVGLGATYVLGRTLRTFLYGIEPTDTASLGVSIVVLAVAALAACAVPALRATRIDPVVALRAE